jgi:hypothetical protein
LIKDSATKSNKNLKKKCDKKRYCEEKIEGFEQKIRRISNPNKQLCSLMFINEKKRPRLGEAEKMRCCLNMKGKQRITSITIDDSLNLNN